MNCGLTGNCSVAMSAQDSDRTVPSLSQLRSAFLRRQVPPNATKNPKTQLRQHFRVVLKPLEQSREVSLKIAVERLEQHLGQRWDAVAKEGRRELLCIRRTCNILRLSHYAAKGRFPINHQSVQPIPILVDHQDTACAVGHLMRLSGWESEVASVAGLDNYVCVINVDSGPIADWIVLSGLLQEEAALIQPAYPFRFQYEPADGTVTAFVNPDDENNSPKSHLEMASMSGLFLPFARCITSFERAVEERN